MSPDCVAAYTVKADTGETARSVTQLLKVFVHEPPPSFDRNTPADVASSTVLGDPAVTTIRAIPAPASASAPTKVHFTPFVDLRSPWARLPMPQATMLLFK